MANPTYKTALIVGAGRGLSASLARLFASEGLRVALAARDTAKLAPLCAETGAKSFACDAVEPDQVASLFAAIEAAIGAPAASWSRERRHPAWCPMGTGRSCSPALPRASRAIRFRRLSRWASLRCVVLPRAWRASSPRKAFTLRTSSSTGRFATRAGSSRRIGRTVCSTPTRSPPPTSTCSASHAPLGPGRSSCGRGSSGSEAAGFLVRRSPRRRPRHGRGLRPSWSGAPSRCC